jgi:SAM-dependent methyltransferase
LFGIDLLSERLEKAYHLSPNLHFVCASADNLPCPNEFFDLVMQFTVFTSILDNDMRKRVAEEMLRVLKPKGLIIWYDFWINPINPDVRPIKHHEIAHLFPDCRLDSQRVTLAPPIARRLARLSWLACHLLGKIPWLQTHYLVAITKTNAQENL